MNRTIIGYITAAVGILAALALLGWFVLLPAALTAMLPGVVNDAQDAVVLRSCPVRLVGLKSTSLRGVKLSVPDVAEVEVGEVHVTYTLAGLRAGRLREVRASDVLLELLHLPTKKRTDGGSADAPKIEIPDLPPLDRVVVSDGRLRLPLNETTHTIPFTLDFSTDQERSEAGLTLQAELLGANVNAGADLRLAEQSVSVRADLEGLALTRLLPLLGLLPDGMAMQGLASGSVSGSYDLRNNTPQLNRCDLTVAAPVLMEQGRVLVSGTGVQASVRQAPNGGFPFEVDMQPAHGFGAAIILQAEGQIRTGNALALEADYILEQQGDEFPAKARLDGRLQGSLSPDGWAAECKGNVLGTLRLGKDSLVMDGAAYALRANGKGTDGTLDWELLLPGRKRALAGLKLQSRDVRASGSLSGSLASDLAGPVQATLPRLRVCGEEFQAGADLDLRGSLRVLPRPEASVTLKGRRIFARTPAAEIGKTSFSLPLVYPPARGKRGYLAVPEIRATGRQLGRLELGMRQDGLRLRLNGAYLSALLPGLRAVITARLAPGPLLEAKAEVKEYALPTEFELSRLTPALKGITGSGTISGRADLRYDACGLAGTGQARLSNGAAADAKRDVRVDGVNLSLELPDLLKLRSAPLQRAAFGSLRYKDVIITDGQLLFMQYGPQRTISEGVRFSWLGGQVQSLPFQIASGRSDYDLTLYCSNLNIAQLLKQLGFAHARGEGEISGKIPVRIRNGRVSFDNAQLQSSPEAGGHIMIREAEALLSGVPPDSPQYVQMKIVSEALKDFEYKWAKVTATSEGEILRVKLQLDGKPAENLPFEYSEDLGLIEMKAKGQGLKFQGIRLDVNFNLPLDRMLRLRELFGQEQ